MTTCIKCGQPIPDGELFCESCGLNGEVPQPRPALRPVGRMQTPVKREPRPGKPQPAPAPEKKSRGGRAAVRRKNETSLPHRGRLVSLV